MINIKSVSYTHLDVYKRQHTHTHTELVLPICHFTVCSSPLHCQDIVIYRLFVVIQFKTAYSSHTMPCHLCKKAYSTETLVSDTSQYVFSDS